MAQPIQTDLRDIYNDFKWDEYFTYSEELRQEIADMYTRHYVRFEGLIPDIYEHFKNALQKSQKIYEENEEFEKSDLTKRILNSMEKKYSSTLDT